MRAATTACTVGGTAPTWPPSRSSMPVVSTMKNGLPPARSAIVSASRSSMRSPPA